MAYCPSACKHAVSTSTTMALHVSVPGNTWHEPHILGISLFFSCFVCHSSSQALVTLPSEQKIQAAVAIGNSVWVSVQGSPMVHLCHAPSGILITSIDCTAAIMDLLKREPV